MGEEDYLFLPTIRKAVSYYSNAQLQVLKNAGHVVNVDQPKEFNDVAIKFLNTI